MAINTEELKNREQDLKLIARALCDSGAPGMEQAIQDMKADQRARRVRRMTGRQERRLAYFLGIHYGLAAAAIGVETVEQIEGAQDNDGK